MRIESRVKPAMTDTDITALVERLRFCATELDSHYSRASIFAEAADALEALQVQMEQTRLVNLDLEFELVEARGQFERMDARITDGEQAHRDFRLQNDREWKAKVDHQKARAERMVRDNRGD
jgi:hypothetical protein